MIYFVEDNPFDRQLLQYLLADEPSEFFDRSETLLEAVAANQHPNLIVTDHRLPGMLGLDLVAELKRRVPEIPVVVLASSLVEGEKTEALAAGAIRVIRKPENLIDGRRIVADLIAIGRSHE